MYWLTFTRHILCTIVSDKKSMAEETVANGNIKGVNSADTFQQLLKYEYILFRPCKQ
jgi:hypothetical protein